MTKEKLFELAAEKGWHEILEVARHFHSLSEIATKLNKKKDVLQTELLAMCSAGMLYLSGTAKKGHRYVPSFLGIKFLQEQNKKKGRTYSCQLCGTTTGIPHLCPEFYPEFREE